MNKISLLQTPKNKRSPLPLKKKSQLVHYTPLKINTSIGPMSARRMQIYQEFDSSYYDVFLLEYQKQQNYHGIRKEGEVYVAVLKTLGTMHTGKNCKQYQDRLSEL